MVSRIVLYVHMVVASFICLFMHWFALFITDIFPFLWRLERSFELKELTALVLGYLLSYVYFRLFRVENPKVKALITTIVGAVLFWGSCIAMVCALAPGLRNM